jgi:hypothetical protein
MLRKASAFLIISLFGLFSTASVRGVTYEIVIYGGGPQAVSAALTAVSSSPRADVLMIVPERQLGSTMTAGRQNLFDLNYHKPSSLPPGLPADYTGSQGGSLYRFVKALGAVFAPSEMESYFVREIRTSGRIRILYESDITHADLQENSSSLKELHFRQIRKDPQNGRYRFSGTAASVQAKVFIDASETGRLLRLTGAEYTTGREDTGKDQLQMVATLMYKVKGVDAYAAIAPNKTANGVAYSTRGSFQFWGGREVYTIPEILAYDKNSPYFRLKAYNAGEDGYSHVGADTSKTPFWMNHMIIYKVDGRKMWRDRELDNGLYPDSPELDPEEARELALEELKKPEYWEMIRKLPGFSNVEPVLENGEPAAGEILYLRETIHALNKPGAGKAHALTEADVMKGGQDFYDRRIGVGFYNFDSNTYQKQEALTNPLHEPWYVPYEVLQTPYVDNLLLPGYAANIDSYSWSAMRVYPNLIMLGDAAGTSAALAADGRINLAKPDMDLLQKELLRHQAILEK